MVQELGSLQSVFFFRFIKIEQVNREVENHCTNCVFTGGQGF